MQRLKKLVPLYFLLLIFLAASWAIFVPGFFRVHDYTHAGRIAEMVRALTDGHFPVRWTENFGYGYGMPLFEFYAPLPFYVGAILYWLGLNAVGSIKVLYLLSNALTALGGYLLGKKLFGRAGGILTAAALTLAPYRAVNLFVRGALNEAWAMLFLPWILLGVIKVFHREPRGWLWLTLPLVGLFLSHNITLLLFTPILILFCLGYFGYLLLSKSTVLFRKSRFRWRSFTLIISQFFGSGLLAIGLAAFYLGPAFLEKDLTQFESLIFTPYFDYHLHFLYLRQFLLPNWGYGGSSWGVEDGISFFLGWGQWLSLGVLAVLLLKRIWHWLRQRQPIWPTMKAETLTIGFGLLLSGSLYFSLLRSQWLWDQIGLLRFAQFPWRWLNVATIFLALLVGSLAWLVAKKWQRIWLTGLLSLAMIIGAAGYFRPANFLTDPTDYYYTDPTLIRQQLSDVLPDYLPQGMTRPPAVIPDKLVINETELTTGQTQILVDRVQEKLLQTSFSEQTRLSLAIADYPGWRVEIDDQRWSRERGADGNIEVVVPAGQHILTVRFLSTPVREYADLISLASLVILVWLLLPRPKLVKELS